MHLRQCTYTVYTVHTPHSSCYYLYVCKIHTEYKMLKVFVIQCYCINYHNHLFIPYFRSCDKKCEEKSMESIIFNAFFRANFFSSVEIATRKLAFGIWFNKVFLRPCELDNDRECRSEPKKSPHSNNALCHQPAHSSKHPICKIETKNGKHFTLISIVETII